MKKENPIKPKLGSDFMKIKSQRKEICAAVPFVDGFPSFSGSLETYWTMLRGWEGNITVNDKVFETKISYKKWITLNIDKRQLGEGIPMLMTKCWKNFREAYENEQALRRDKFKKIKSTLDSDYYQNNKVQLNLYNKEHKAIQRLKHEERTNEVFEMIVKGKPRWEIIKFFSERDKVTEKVVTRSIIAAYGKIREATVEEREDLRQRHKAMLEELYRKNIEMGDLREARNVLQDIRKIYGVDAPEQKQVEIKQQIFKFNFDNPISDEEVNRIKASSKGEIIEFKDIDFKDVSEDNIPPVGEDNQTEED